MAKIHPSRGLTLIETMITLAVSVIVLAAAVTAANAQSRAYYKGQKLRTAQGASRDALVLLERMVPLAGYGLDAALAIDFQWYTPPASLCPPEIGTCQRDRTDDADELVFYARNPSFWVAPGGAVTPAPKGKAWMLSSVDSTWVKLDAHTGDQFLPGQILQAVCPGTLNYAYFTVKTKTPASAPYGAETAAAQVDLQDVDLANPFKRQDVAKNLAMGASCRVFQIDRYRLHVKPVSMGNGRYDPFLVLDDGVNPEVLLVEGIEAFQVAYVLADPSGVAGDAPGTAITFSTANADQTVTGTIAPESIARTNFPGSAPKTGQTVYSPSSFYLYSYSSTARQTIHQANIRAIEIALVARSPEPDPTSRTNLVVDDQFTLLDQKGIPNWIKNEPKLSLGTDGYQRVRVQATINLPNMLVRSLPAF